MESQAKRRKENPLNFGPRYLNPVTSPESAGGPPEYRALAGGMGEDEGGGGGRGGCSLLKFAS